MQDNNEPVRGRVKPPPVVSVIMPCYNEVRFIREAVESVICALRAAPAAEFLIADGGSDDGTLEVLSELAEKYDVITVLHNAKRKQVFALNQLLDMSAGEFIVRCDAHAIYPSDYIERLVEYLKAHPEVGNVGTQVATIAKDTSVRSEAIARCMSSVFGVGSSHRIKSVNDVRLVDTLLFGAWSRKVFDEVGSFDISFVRGQDAEHNYRIRKAGYSVVQIPGPSLQYIARESIAKLFKLMLQYASVKPAILKKHGGLPTVRSLVPATLLAILLGLVLVDTRLAGGLLLVYGFCCILFSALEILKNNDRLSLLPYVAVGFMAQHLGHAIGFYLGIFRVMFGKTDWGGTR
ncbi:MAG: glycosyltransferase family 2 protein [Pseudomonadales bacterium]